VCAKCNQRLPATNGKNERREDNDEPARFQVLRKGCSSFFFFPFPLIFLTDFSAVTFLSKLKTEMQRAATRAAVFARRAGAQGGGRRWIASSASPSTPDSFGFVGLGHMGLPMARNLAEKTGIELIVFDTDARRVDELEKSVSSTVVRASSAEEVAQKVTRALVTMLPSSPQVQEVYQGERGVFAGLASRPEGTPFPQLIDASTIDPLVAREVAVAAGEVGATMVDAPVSGGVGGAEGATLTFMVGGSEEAFSEVRPFLEQMGANIVHCGGSGSGQIAKVCNNHVLGVSMIAVAEAMNLGIRLGADAKTLAKIFNSSSARCWASDTYNPVPGVMENVPASRSWDGGFGVDLMAKVGLRVR
jgi:3-hydroxyisobutyrate dehydrogenase